MPRTHAGNANLNVRATDGVGSFRQREEDGRGSASHPATRLIPQSRRPTSLSCAVMFPPRSHRSGSPAKGFTTGRTGLLLSS